MKVTVDNIANIERISGYDLENGKMILKALLDDIKELNDLLIDKGESYRQIYIDYINEHTEYSPERVDPCPDYYGMFALRFERNPYETIGDIMLLDEVDNAICILINFMEFKLS